MPVQKNHSKCPFCDTEPGRIVLEGPHIRVIRDSHPISPGHTLIIPRRHIASIFDASEEEWAAMRWALHSSKLGLDKELQPDGYNIGINDGAHAGQTVAHLHIHLIPRYEGDTVDPRGGVRWLFPDKVAYWNDENRS